MRAETTRRRARLSWREIRRAPRVTRGKDGRKLDEVAVFTLKGDKVVKEEFFYSAG